METSNVLTDKWIVSGSTNFDDETYFQITNELKDTTYEAIEYKEKLIQTAVNACKSINPNNPIKVAEVLPDMFHDLKMLPSYLEQAANALDIFSMRNGNTNALTPKLNWYADKIRNSLKQATE